MFVNQLAYFIAIRNSIYSEQVESPFSAIVGEDIRRLDSVLWVVRLGTDYDSEYGMYLDAIIDIFEMVVSSYVSQDHAGMLSYLTMFKNRCQRAINELNAE